MSILVEPVLLYIVLFLRFLPAAAYAPAVFSPAAALTSVIMHTVPSAALLLYVMSRAKPLARWGIARPRAKDVLPGITAGAAIAVVGTAVMLAARRTGGLPAMPRMLPPSGITGWAALALFVFAAAYFEELFFRVYLPAKLAEAPGITTVRAVAVSTLMFAVCHVYAGPWGFVNAALSGAVLAVVFLRTKSFHGVGIAHGLYNMAVFALGPA